MKKMFFLLIIMMVKPITTMADSFDIDCLIKPEMTVELSSTIDGVVKDMLISRGETITKNQPLVQLESSVEKARVDLAKQQMAATGEVQNRRVQVKFAALNNKRIKKLYLKKTISKFELDKSDTELAIAKLELQQARERREIARTSLNLAQAQLALKTLKSPIDGIVVDIYAMIGESIDDRAIMKLAQINPLKVEVISPTEHFRHIHKGMKVTIQAEYPVSKIVVGTVTVVDQLIDAASGSFTVHIALPNQDDELIAGTNCLASFPNSPDASRDFSQTSHNTFNTFDRVKP